MQAEGESIAKLHDNISAVNKTILETMNDLRAHYDYENMKISNLVTSLPSKVDVVSNDQQLQLQKLTNIEQYLDIIKSHVHGEIKTVELVSELQKNISAINKTALVGIRELKAQHILLHCFPVHQHQKKLTIKALQQE